MKILVVDNNPKMCSHISDLLQHHLPQKPEIAISSGAAQAIKMYRELTPDWVIMDVKLNGQNGLYATAEIHKSDPSARIIVITQYEESAYRQEARARGAFAFIMKDKLLDLIAVINSVL